MRCMSSNVFTLTELMMIDKYYIYKYPINVVSSNVSEISVLLFLQKKKKNNPNLKLILKHWNMHQVGAWDTVEIA